MEATKESAHASVDSFIHARKAKFTMNLSPVTQLLAFLDWFINLADSPGKQYRIMEDFWEKTANYWDYVLRSCLLTNGEPEKPIARDPRFRDDAWQTHPYNCFF